MERVLRCSRVENHWSRKSAQMSFVIENPRAGLSGWRVLRIPGWVGLHFCSTSALCPSEIDPFIQFQQTASPEYITLCHPSVYLLPPLPEMLPDYQEKINILKTSAQASPSLGSLPSFFFQWSLSVPIASSTRYCHIIFHGTPGTLLTLFTSLTTHRSSHIMADVMKTRNSAPHHHPG